MPGNQTRLSVKVRPGARKNEITGFAGGVLEIRVAAPPADNRANLELVAFLSQALGLSKSSVTILRGHTGRHKLVLIDGLSQDEVTKRLTSFSSGTATRQ
jgi:hypothetical protein